MTEEQIQTMLAALWGLLDADKRVNKYTNKAGIAGYGGQKPVLEFNLRAAIAASEAT